VGWIGRRTGPAILVTPSSSSLTMKSRRNIGPITAGLIGKKKAVGRQFQVGKIDTN